MPAESWTALTSLAGVALGGGLSYLVQVTNQRTTVRTEQRKLETTRGEGRRTERLALLERFIAVAADAERRAFERPAEFAPDGEWAAGTQAVMDRFWVAERMVRVLFPPPVYDAARAYFLILNEAVWQGVAADVHLRDRLEAPRLAFLDAARAALES